MDVWDFLLGVATGLVSHAIIKTAPKLKDKLAEKHYRSRWSNPYYRWLVLENGFIVGMTIIYIGAIATWVTGSYPFDITGIISMILAVPVYLGLFRMRARDSENYFVSSFTEAMKNGQLVFVPDDKRKQ